MLRSAIALNNLMKLTFAKDLLLDNIGQGGLSDTPISVQDSVLPSLPDHIDKPAYQIASAGKEGLFVNRGMRRKEVLRSYLKVKPIIGSHRWFALGLEHGPAINCDGKPRVTALLGRQAAILTGQGASLRDSQTKAHIAFAEASIRPKPVSTPSTMRIERMKLRAIAPRRAARVPTPALPRRGRWREQGAAGSGQRPSHQTPIRMVTMVSGAPTLKYSQKPMVTP